MNDGNIVYMHWHFPYVKLCATLAVPIRRRRKTPLAKGTPFFPSTITWNSRMHSAMQKPLASYKKDTFEAFCMGKVAKCENWGLQIDEIVYGIATQSHYNTG